MSGQMSWQLGWRDSSVGKSTRFIPVVSLVQIQFPLLRTALVMVFRVFIVLQGIFRCAATLRFRREAPII